MYFNSVVLCYTRLTNACASIVSEQGVNWPSWLCCSTYLTWWRLIMGMLSVLLCLCEGNPMAACGYPVTKVQQYRTLIMTLGMNKLLNKQSIYPWFNKPWYSCDFIVMKYPITFQFLGKHPCIKSGRLLMLTDRVSKVTGLFVSGLDRQRKEIPSSRSLFT